MFRCGDGVVVGGKHDTWTVAALPRRGFVELLRQTQRVI
jgi:hypothetical protein